MNVELEFAPGSVSNGKIVQEALSIIEEEGGVQDFTDRALDLRGNT